MARHEDMKGLPRNLLSSLFHGWTWRMAWRDSRSQRVRLVIFSLSIIAGIAALVAIHSLKASVRKGIDTQAKSLLGSDLQISSRQEIPAGEIERLRKMARSISREVAFPTMMKFPEGAARLVQVRGIEGGYPYYGEVGTRPADAWGRLQGERGVLLEAALLDQFQVKVGDEVEIGTVRLRILGAVEKPAPRGGRFTAFAPEAYVRLGDVEQSGLLGTSSMSMRQLHLEMPDAPPSKELKDQIRESFASDAWKLETPDDRRENLGDAVERFEQFLGILALASLALGAIGVAGAVQAHIRRRTATVAILRCLGCPAHLASAVYFAQAGALGLLGSVAGALAGMAVHGGILMAFRDRLPIAVGFSPEWVAVGQTAAAGFAVCCGFALVPLLGVRRISPAATLRAAAEEKGAVWRALPVYGVLGGLLILLAMANEPNVKRAFGLVAGLGLAFGVFAGLARALMALTRRLVTPRWPYLLRQGISNLHRPGNQTLLFLLSLGLGTFLMVTILLAGNLLRKRLDLTGSAGSPNLYLVDVQADQVEGVKRLLGEMDLPVLESQPMVTMRIQSVKGVPVRKAKGVPGWVARREFRSTYRAAMTATETLVAGEWVNAVADPEGPVPLSLEQEMARDLKVGVGDEVVLDVQGVSVTTRVVNLRKVDWSRFNLNFFMVFPPGVLEGAPGFHVVTTRTPTVAASGAVQRELVSQFPSVSAIDLTQILEMVRDITGKISLGISLLAGCTLLAGIPILVGTLLNGRDVRVRESVLLRTLGASAGQVRMILVIEYAALGFLSALTGVLLAATANAALAVWVFKGSPVPDAGLLVSAVVTVTGLSVAGGSLMGRGVSRHPPLEILRSI